MNAQVRLYCWLALISSVCSVAFALYERDVAFKESHMSGVLYFQNNDMARRISELEMKLENAQRQSYKCQSKR